MHQSFESGAFPETPSTTDLPWSVSLEIQFGTPFAMVFGEQQAMRTQANKRMRKIRHQTYLTDSSFEATSGITPRSELLRQVLRNLDPADAATIPVIDESLNPQQQHENQS